jgi:hypothetical protein
MALRPRVQPAVPLTFSVGVLVSPPVLAPSGVKPLTESVYLVVQILMNLEMHLIIESANVVTPTALPAMAQLPHVQVAELHTF